jgi:acyl-coenzyme A synthetase/AMP-(fatty) acid ligase
MAKLCDRGSLPHAAGRRQVPRELRFKGIPKTSTCKIQKFALRQRTPHGATS